ncbi:MAG: phosphate acyltransferase [bacterium]
MNRQPIHSAQQLIERAIEIASQGRKKTVAVAAAQDVDVIGAMADAYADGFLNGILCGDRSKILALADEGEINIEGLEIIDEADVSLAAQAAVGLASEGKADAVMKGFLPTSALLKTVLDRRFNLRAKKTISHCAVLDIPGYHKLLNFTDGGMVVKPDKETKYEILENAVMVMRALGLSPVKVALSGTLPRPSDRVPHTLTDVAYIIPRAEDNLEDVVVQGPLSLDVATSPGAARAYEVAGAVAGDADIFLVDSIEECNIVCKALINFAEAVFSGVIVGAKVPVSLVSRTDSMMNKKSSLALACVLSDYYAQTNAWAERAARP